MTEEKNTMESNSCTIGLGSNTPDREEQIKRAISHISGYLSKFDVSSVYESEAFNGKDKPYFNAVIQGYTSEGYDNLIAILKDWESSCGRTKTDSAAGIVPIDLDLVIWNQHIVRPKDFERHYFNRGYRELLSKGAYDMI